MTEREILEKLIRRYIKMLGVKDQHLRNMLLTMLENVSIWPEGKLNRWLGYIQKSLIDLKLTTIEKEKRITDPLFSQLYNINALSN